LHRPLSATVSPVLSPRFEERGLSLVRARARAHAHTQREKKVGGCEHSVKKKTPKKGNKKQRKKRERERERERKERKKKREREKSITRPPRLFAHTRSPARCGNCNLLRADNREVSGKRREKRREYAREKLIPRRGARVLRVMTQGYARTEFLTRTARGEPAAGGLTAERASLFYFWREIRRFDGSTC